jgi:hypothetical protein
MSLRSTLLLSLLVAFGSMTVDHPQNQNAVAEGSWGGEHISLQVTDAGATIDYDCAHGTITERMVLDRTGKFEAKGFHVREGGPVRAGGDEDGKPALYIGTTDGKTLKLTVKLASSGETIGTFDLTHGKSGRIRKCK